MKSRNPGWLLVVAAILTLVAAPADALEITLLSGLANGGEFGEFAYQVRNAGDLNNDGMVDFVAGAPFDSQPGLNAGRAFVWFGGSELTGAPDLILDDSNGADYFGFAVAGVGDVDGDGYDDLAVGAPGADRPGGLLGVVYVYRGGLNMNDGVDLELEGEIGGDRFGWSIAGVGDMDRDGTDDFVVGAPYNDTAGTDVGRVYLFTGQSSMSSIGPDADLIYSGETGGGPTNTTEFAEFAPDSQPINGPGFGFSVTSMYDFKGDSRAAFAVGAPGQNGAQGRAYIFFASSSSNQLPSATPASTLTNNTSNEEFGWSVANGGYVNTGTQADLLVGAPGVNGHRGSVHIYFGTSSPPATDSSSNGERFQGVAGDRFGFSIAGVGDALGTTNGWIVGAPANDNAGLKAGRVYLYEGTSTSATILGPVNPGGAPVAEDQWGFSVDGLLGDLDGDGLNDFLVGAPTANAADNAVRGVLAIISSGDRIVAATTVRLDAARRSGSEVELDFVLSTGTRIDDAVLSSGGRDLARLGAGIWAGPRGLTARVPLAELSSDSVDLRWTAAGLSGQASFALPAFRARQATLHAPTPNPFNPRTTLTVEMPQAAHARLRIVDLRGRVVRELHDGRLEAGITPIVFDGTDDQGRRLASGSYMALLESADSSDSRRLTLVQ